MRIFAGVPLGGGIKLQCSCRRRQFFGNLGSYFFGNFRDKASSIIWRYATLGLSASNWLQNAWHRMALSGYFMSKSVFGQHFVTQSVWLFKLIVWKVTNIDPYCQWQKCRSMTLVSGVQIISRYSKAFLRLLSLNRSVVAEIDDFAVFLK